jgi:hypothetical protein
MDEKEHSIFSKRSSVLRENSVNRQNYTTSSAVMQEIIPGQDSEADAQADDNRGKEQQRELLYRLMYAQGHPQMIFRQTRIYGWW